MYLQAGLKDSQLFLALEPEAASIYSRKISGKHKTLKDGDKQIARLKADTKYLVVDCGGNKLLKFILVFYVPVPQWLKSKVS